ncbi:MAG: tetratricopeptide repeat protein [Stenotrophomonas sp.]|uniref:tetratricopeptide repeat protein n=1 Tax=Stenotrophomonas sp. TaxID=69392 RepID=UPI003D6C8724
MTLFSPRVMLCTFSLFILTACGATAPTRPISDTERDALAAAADGQFDSAMRVARMYQAWNDPRALDWYARAAATTPRTHHTTSAEERLGTILERGRLDSSDEPQKPEAVVLKPSPRKAFRWYQSAAYHGSPYAMHDLEKWYTRQGDLAGALRWRLRSAVYQRELYKLDALRTATSGSAKAGSPIAIALSSNAAIARIQRQAARGDAEAQVDLGALHEAGIGVVESKAEALRWYQRSGEQGNVYGQYFSGLILGRGGKGMEKDVDAAAAWFARANAQEFYLAQESYWRNAIAPPFFIFE